MNQVALSDRDVGEAGRQRRMAIISEIDGGYISSSSLNRSIIDGLVTGGVKACRGILAQIEWLLISF